MQNEKSFQDITPYVRFSATQKLANSAPYLKYAYTIAYDHRIYYCTEGEGEIYIENIKYKLKPYSLLIWRSGLRYKLERSDNNLTCITVNFDYFKNDKTPRGPIAPQGSKYFIKKDIFEPNLIFIDNKSFNDIIFIENGSDFDDLMKEIVKTYREDFIFSKTFLSGLLLTLFKKILEYIQKHNTYSDKESIHEIVKFIQANYRHELSNETIAAHFSYHPNYLSRLFYEHTGYTLHNYIIKYRLSRAVKLLMSSSLPISKIGEAVNIQDQHYFSRIFKKYYKISPSKFRQK